MPLNVPEKIGGGGGIRSYLFEGNVPPSDIIEFLKRQPDTLGLFVPGMPIGSPGMEMGGQTEPYEVVMVGIDGSRSVFARH